MTLDTLRLIFGCGSLFVTGMWCGFVLGWYRRGLQK